MKKILFPALTLLLAPSLLFAYTSPGKPTGLVNDFAKIFTTEQKSALEVKIGNFQRPAGVEMAVVTVPSLGDETIETYAVKLFEEWGIGNKLSDNGLLLLVAPNDRAVRIEVGYGLEPYMTDAQSSGIVRNILIPAFREGKYYEGVDGAVSEIELVINKDPEALGRVEQEKGGFSMSSEFIAVIFFLIINLISVMARSKSWWLGGIIGAIIGGILFKAITAVVIGSVIGLIVDFLLSLLADKLPKGPGGGPIFFGGGFGGRGGGGFGGFGGGMSGGGGSSGRW